MKAEWTNSDSLTTSQTTKAILVIDKPKDCFTCELGGSKVCIGGCPLKPLPDKLPLESGSIMNTFKESTKYKHIGYNACLDDIFGDTK